MNWQFMFITPPGCEVEVKASPEVEKSLEGVIMYSADLKIEEEEAQGMLAHFGASSAVAIGGNGSIFLVFREGFSPNAQ